MSNRGGRFSLVIGSQCDALGRHRALDLLAEAATGLDVVLRDPLRGDCRPALADGRSCLLDEGRTATYSAVAQAAETVGQAGGALLLAWIGHGMAVNGDFYVLPQGCTPVPGHPEGPYGLMQHLRELLAGQPDLELVLLLDACMSGAGIAEAAARWTALNDDLRRRIQILSAANIDESAYDCSFSRSAVALLRHGHIALGERLTASDLKREAERHERRQQPAVLTLDGVKAGPALWLARNAALTARTGSVPALSRADLPALCQALRHFRPGPALADVVQASRTCRYVAVSGPAGYGKTTLLAALTRPEVAPGTVPHDFVHGLRLFRRQETSDRVARDLAMQLSVTVPGFREASAAHEASVPRTEWDQLPQAERLLFGPLGAMPGTLVRLALDGFDQLADSSAAELADLVGRLRSLPEDGADLRLVISARPGAAPAAEATVELGPAPEADVRSCLAAQEVPAHLLDATVAAAEGSWLVASLLADQVRADPCMAAGDVPRGLGAVYDLVLDAALEGGAAWDAADAPVRAAFTVLAAAGPGAVLPRELLFAACAELGAAGIDETWLTDGPAASLRRYVVQAAAGDGAAETMLYGLFHQSLIDHLSGDVGSAYSVDLVAGHRALAAVLTRLAPAEEYTPALAQEPLQEYARQAEAEHLWRSGAHLGALESLAARPSPVPADNLRQWQHWHEVARRTYGSEHFLTTITHHNVAAHTGMAGYLQQALELYASRQDAPEGSELSLIARANLAAATGEAGDAERALDLCTALLPEAEDVLGPDHPLTLTVRSNIALWSGRAGNARRALELSVELLGDRTRVLGPNDPSTLTTRHNVALWTAESGDHPRALALFERLLPDRVRVLGPDHSDTHAVRNNIALLTQETDLERAYELFSELLDDRVRILGSEHPETLITHSNLCRCIAYRGDLRGALEMCEELLALRVAAFGPDHPETLKNRFDVATMTGRTGQVRQETDLLAELLPDMERVLGPDHPTTLTTRAAMAFAAGQLGKARKAVQLWAAVLEDRTRVLGPEHPDTLETQVCHALEIAGAGSPGQALRLTTALLPVHVRALGRDHRSTLYLRFAIAGLTARSNTDRALQLLSDLLKDQNRVLGLTHRDVSATGQFIRALTEKKRRRS
ncbi:tetratricopeptide repeat protein [Streptomyces fuscichromogenes]|uniref:tetratricopeptide repeat protein n=1 Tax=Streptomyces fuscichromogenes TaxID=1324013 RepID=UPI003816E9FB